jgi:NitT/TauT family transport system substrate-binding protein
MEKTRRDVMKKFIVPILSIIICIALVTACAPAPNTPAPAVETEPAGGVIATSETSEATAPEITDTVVMVFPRSIEVLDDAHVVAADMMGYFAEEGIEVKYEQSYGTSDVKMIASGQGTVAYPSPYIQLMGHESELPIISVYQVDVRNIFGFSVLPDSDIKTIADLKGKTISLGDAAWSSISDPLLQNAGLDPKTDVEYVVAGENRAQMVAEGKLDAVLTWEKEYQLWDAQGIVLRYMTGEAVLDNCSNSLIVSLDTYKNNKDLIVRFLRAYAKGSYFTKLNPRAATEMVLEKYPSIKVDFEAALKAIEGLVYIDNNADTEKYGYGYHNADKWAINIVDALANGMITKDIPLDQIYTNEFVEAANQFDHAAAEADAANYQLKPEHQP